MAKRFFEVFPTLKLNGELHNLMEETEVAKVTSNSARTALKVYLESGRLIEKPKVFFIEREITQQLFPNRGMTVKIMEKFHLSQQYTPEKLMDVYKDSILSELHNYSLLLYNLFRCAKMDFDREDHMRLILEDTIVAQNRSEELVDILEKVICERCRLKLMIEPEYEEAKEGRFKQNSELQLQQEVSNIVRMAALHKPEDGQSQEKDEAQTKPKTGEKSAVPATKSTQAPAASGKGDFKGRGGFGKRDFYKKSDNPDVIYGRDFEDDVIPIETIVGEMGEVAIRGQILTLDTREIRGEKTIVIMSMTDFTDTIVLKVFTKNENLADLLGGLKKGAFIKVKGVTTIDKFDSELTIGSIVGIKKIPDFTSVRMDNSPEKRVELHCHTKMSDMDGVSDVQDIIKRAAAWGHKAIAITDHGAIQAFPIANHTSLPEGQSIKIIYGVEAYLVDDLKDIVENSKKQSLDDAYVVFDIETTGFSPLVNKIIEIGAVKVIGGKITERFSTFVNPQIPIPFHIENLTSIRDDMVMDAPTIEEILPEFLKFCEGCVMVAHNADFDMSFIRHNCDLQGISYDFTIADTVALARMLLPNLNRFKLDTVAKAVNVPLGFHHRAVDDAACTADIFVKFIEMLKERGIVDLDGVNAEGHITKQMVMKMPTYHAIILATNEIGRA